MTSGAARLRELIARPVPVVVPLVLDPISAKIAGGAGFEALYLGGGTLGYVKTCTEANLTLTQMAQTGLEIRAACDLPLILDAACGYGDPMHLRHTVAMAEAAGFAAIEIEDQMIPKRAHHHIGVEHLIPMDLMAHKIREAAAARRDPDFVIIGRTNACRSDGLDDALRRGEAYRSAGADMLLVLQKTPEEVRAIGERLGGPLFYFMPSGVGSMDISLEEMGRLGYRIVCDGVTPFYARQKALRLAYEALARGLPDPTVAGAYQEEDRWLHQAIDLDILLDIERRTVER
ncbi:MAG: Carboxyvinyl-carboxyphosphonate phosphorylmutase [Polaromonas sp.]|nr:Carboxyvinyl-carboxyphosphonate phosphorylmutase [Polaromonas sp.]